MTSTSQPLMQPLLSHSTFLQTHSVSFDTLVTDISFQSLLPFSKSILWDLWVCEDMRGV